MLFSAGNSIFGTAGFRLGCPRLGPTLRQRALFILWRKAGAKRSVAILTPGNIDSRFEARRTFAGGNAWQSSTPPCRGRCYCVVALDAIPSAYSEETDGRQINARTLARTRKEAKGAMHAPCC